MREGEGVEGCVGEEEVGRSVWTGGSSYTPASLSQTHTSTEVYRIHLQVGIVRL